MINSYILLKIQIVPNGKVCNKNINLRKIEVLHTRSLIYVLEITINHQNQNGIFMNKFNY